MIAFIVAVILLGILVVVHEGGHFVVAKLSRISAPIFSIGFGPKLFSFKKGETEYRISAIPFGGYVKLKGMEPGEYSEEENAFYNKSPLIRLGVVLAGPISNFILGFLIFWLMIVFTGIEVPPFTKVGKVEKGSVAEKSGIEKGDSIIFVNGRQVKDFYDIENLIGKGNVDITFIRDGKQLNAHIPGIKKELGISPFYPPIVGQVEKNSPADSLGLKKGDRILIIGGKKISEWEDMKNIVANAPGKRLTVQWEHNGKILSGNVVPKKVQSLRNDSLVYIGILGIVSYSKTKKIPFYRTFIEGGRRAVYSTYQMLYNLGLIIKRKVSAKALGGPVAIVYLTGKSLEFGWKNLFAFFALISINLFIVNLIPLPPLDGAHALLSLFEIVVRKKPGKKAMQVIEQIGFVIIILLILLVFYNDTIRFGGKFISRFFGK